MHDRARQGQRQPDQPERQVLQCASGERIAAPHQVAVGEPGVLEGVDGTVEGEEGSLYAKLDNVLLSVTLIDASFPNYRQVIPQSGGEGVMVPCELFKNALRRVSILSDQETKSVVVEVEGSTMTLSSDNPSMGDAKETLDVDFAGERIKLAFNAQYLMEILKVVDDDALRMEIKDSLSPTLFMGTDKDVDFLSVVMPMRID